MSVQIDFRYVEIEEELWALQTMLDLMEGNIERLAEANAETMIGDLRARGWEDDEGERQLVHQLINETTDYVLPRYVRGPYVLALWACFESAIGQIAEKLRVALGATLGVSELQVRGGPHRRAARYFDAVLGTPLDENSERLRRLDDLYRIRNALAHANGQRDGMSERRWRQLHEALARHGMTPDEYRGTITLSPAYLSEACRDVSECLDALIARARARTPRSESDR